MRQSLATLTLVLALLTAAPAAAQEVIAVLQPPVQQAVVWRAAGLRLQIQLEAMAEVMRAPVLAATVEAWSRNPAQADPRREAETVVRGADVWIARIEARLPYARWPADRAPEIYRREAELTLAQARFDLAYASGSLGSPAGALAKIFMVDGWTRGISFRNNPFNDSDDDADAALLSMIPRPGGPTGELAGGPRSAAPRPAAGDRTSPFGAGSPPPAVYPAPGPSAGPGLASSGRQAFRAVWAGMGPDLVSPNASGQPDGAPDSRFQVDFYESGRLLKRLDVYSVNVEGSRTGSRWSSWNGAYWALGIQGRAGRLNPSGPLDSLGISPQSLMLSVTSDGSVRPGAAFEIEATFVDGGAASARVVVGAASDGPAAGLPGYGPVGGVIDFNLPPGAPPGVSAPPPVAGAVQLAWAGLGADQVSASASGRPDGAPDSQIRLQMPGDRRSITRLDMFALNERGERTGSRWSTWHSSFWTLGVTAAGSRLNPAGPVDRLGAPASALVLYATSDGSLRDGARVEVEVTLDDGTVRSGALTIGQAVADLPPIIDGPAGGTAGAERIMATWAGMGSDEVSPNASGRPDGAPDGQVRIQFAANGRLLRRLDIYGLNEQGARTSTHWSSWNPTYWILGVRARASRLNPNGAIESLSFPAQPLTLFITDDGSLRPGRRFEVEATFVDGGTATGRFVVPF